MPESCHESAYSLNSPRRQHQLPGSIYERVDIRSVTIAETLVRDERSGDSNIEYVRGTRRPGSRLVAALQTNGGERNASSRMSRHWPSQGLGLEPQGRAGERCRPSPT